MQASSDVPWSELLGASTDLLRGGEATPGTGDGSLSCNFSAWYPRFFRASPHYPPILPGRPRAPGSVSGANACATYFQLNLASLRLDPVVVAACYVHRTPRQHTIASRIISLDDDFVR